MSVQQMPTAHTAKPIVIVDDDADVQRTFARMLRAAGLADVETLGDERDLLPLLDARPVALVLLDLSMPHIAGEDLLRALVERHPGVPVVVATGTVDIDTAITTADKAREGLVANAANGTLFLDEIGDLPAESQVKLLRLLQNRTSRPVFSRTGQRSSAQDAVLNLVNRDAMAAAARFPGQHP